MNGFCHCYRPQTKFAKVMFSQVSVCPQGGVVDTPLGRLHPPGQVHPLAGTPPQAGTPPPADGRQAGGTHPTGMQSCLRIE